MLHSIPYRIRHDARDDGVRFEVPIDRLGQEDSRHLAVGASALRRMGYPASVGRRTLGRVARPTEHRAIADVERRTASGERVDVIDGQVGGRVGGALVARAPVAVLATPGAEDAGAEPLPGARAVQGVVPATVGLPGVLCAATTRAARQDAADSAQLHGSARAGADAVAARLTLVTLDCTPIDIEMSVVRVDDAVYSLTVLRPGANGCATTVIGAVVGRITR